MRVLEIESFYVKIGKNENYMLNGFRLLTVKMEQLAYNGLEQKSF